jgi:hypothetical protein
LAAFAIPLCIIVYDDYIPAFGGAGASWQTLSHGRSHISATSFLQCGWRSSGATRGGADGA